MIKLGNRVKDLITGFTGIAVGRTEYLYGCTRIVVEPEDLKDGKLIDAVWFDEQRIVTVEERPIPVSAEHSATTGGPHPNPPARLTPPR